MKDIRIGLPIMNKKETPNPHATDHRKDIKMERNDGIWNEEKFIFTYGEFNYIVPRYMRGSLIRYIENHIKPGSFLLAILENDLIRATSKADPTNMKNIPAYVYFLHNFAPYQCWGSEENVRKWLEKGG